MPEARAPSDFAGVAELLGDAAAERAPVRISGAGTKRGWGAPPGPDEDVLELSTQRLDALVSHDPGDLTATVAAGMPLQRLGEHLAPAGQMLALDPPMADRATVGGVVATADSGPWCQRYGAARDQITGVTVALADGTVARSGAGVIRNVAGYDLPRLFCGSFGTLGVILAVSLRLAPVPEQTATALGVATDRFTAARAVARLATASLDLRALDIAWRRGRGGLLAQTTGRQARHRAGRAAAVMAAAGLTGTDVTEQDAPLWARQRSGQRSATQALVRVSARPSQLPELLALSDRCAATLVGRAALGISYLELEAGRLGELRRGLPVGAHADLLDLPADDAVAPSAEPRRVADDATLALMRAVKTAFDPADSCNRGVSIGGI